jgi:hypothetical protein
MALTGTKLAKPLSSNTDVVNLMGAVKSWLDLLGPATERQ